MNVMRAWLGGGGTTVVQPWRGFARRTIGVGAIVLCVVGMSCEREIPIAPSGKTRGYGVEGVVTDAQGRPFPSVQVKLYFQFEFVDANPPPSKNYTVTRQNEVVTVRVVDFSQRVVRTISTLTYSPGSIVVEWNMRDDEAKLVPSGVYFVRYISGGEVKHSYPVTVDGAVTAVTDGKGRYVITGEHLPIGFYPVPLYSSDGSRYHGNFRIAPFVGLDFLVPSAKKSIYASLTKDRVTQIDVQFR